MKIKSLLLGSAAALVAVSGARAADAVVIPEPEAVEYVRVCDAAGAGYFYIPGGETCLKISGYVRYQIDIEERYTGGDDLAANNGIAGFEDGESRVGWSKNTRAQLVIDTANDTQLGWLRGHIALQGNSAGNTVIIDSNPPGDSTVLRTFGLDSAYIELAGLHMGYSDNAYDGGIVGEADVLGGAKRNRIAYTFNAGTFDATISLDDENSSDSSDALPDFIPNVSANVGYDFGVGQARLFGAFDNLTDEYALKARLGLDVGASGRFEVAAGYTSGATYVHTDSTTFGLDEDNLGLDNVAYVTGIPLWAEWTVQAGYQHTLSEKLKLTGNIGYWNNVAHLKQDDFNPNLWNVGATLDYQVVEGFDIKAAVTHYIPTGDLDDVLDSKTTGFVRFQRSF